MPVMTPAVEMTVMSPKLRIASARADRGAGTEQAITVANIHPNRVSGFPGTLETRWGMEQIVMV
jgi:hypothetical protein